MREPREARRNLRTTPGARSCGRPFIRLACGPLAVCCLSLADLNAAGASPDYLNGTRWFPRVWRAYGPARVPPPKLGNGAELRRMVHDGKLELSVKELLNLVVENNLDIAAGRYIVPIAETDILRAKSGQAARGVPAVALPSELFATAIGAGIGGASAVSGGGTGPAAISASARQIVIGPRGVFDPDFQLNLSFDRTSSPLNTVHVAGVPTVTTPSGVMQTRYEQSFPSGTSFSVTFNAQRQSSTQQFLLFNPAYTARLSVAVNQEVLNGFGFAVNRRFLNIAQNDLTISRELFRQTVSTAVMNALNAYWDLVAARENVRVLEEALAANRKLYEDNRKQYEMGLMAMLDVVQAESEVASARRDLIVARTDAQLKELQLKNLVCKDLAGVANVEAVAVDPLPEPRDGDLPALQEALKTALRNRSELRQAEGDVANRELTLRYTRNNLKPVVGVFAYYASSALVSSVGPSFQQVWQQVPYPEYAAGFSVTIPILNRSAQADDARAQIELRQAQLSLRRSQNQAELDVRSAVIGLVQARAQCESTLRAVQSSGAVRDAEQKKLMLGVSTPYRVIQTQRDFVSAQFQEVQARVNYAKAKVQLDRMMGMTLQQNNLSLDEVLRGRP